MSPAVKVSVCALIMKRCMREVREVQSRTILQHAVDGLKGVLFVVKTIAFALAHIFTYRTTHGCYSLIDGAQIPELGFETLAVVETCPKFFVPTAFSVYR